MIRFDLVPTPETMLRLAQAEILRLRRECYRLTQERRYVDDSMARWRASYERIRCTLVSELEARFCCSACGRDRDSLRRDRAVRMDGPTLLPEHGEDRAERIQLIEVD